MRTAADVMTPHPMTTSPTALIEDCARTMVAENFRHLVVTTATGKLAGVASDTAIFGHGRLAQGGWIADRPRPGGWTVAAVVQPVEAVLPATPLREVLGRLLEIEDDALVVVDEHKIPIGIFTEHDAIGLAGEILSDAPTSDAMATALVTASPDTSLQEAWLRMEDHRIRHLPVLLGSRLVDVISIRDLLLVTGTVAAGGTVEQLRDPRRELISVPLGASLKRAALRMAEHKIGCLPVLTARGELAGLLTASDLIKALLRTLPAADA